MFCGTERARSRYGNLRCGPMPLVRSLFAILSVALAAGAAAQVPSRPAGVTATALDQAVELRWRDPADASITAYETRYATSGGTFSSWTRTSGQRTALQVLGLANFIEYIIQLRAVNEDGPGPAAEITATPFVVLDFKPSFEGRTVDPLCFRVGVAVRHRLPPAFATDTYSLSPAPPAGLSFDPRSRIISGTPTAVQPATPYTLTASDFDGDEARLEFTIKVEANLAPSFGDATVADQRFRVGSPIDLTLPAASGGNPLVVYALTPALPAGVVFDADMRTITGTPMTPTALAQYVYTATDDDGDTATLAFGIEVQPDSMPDFSATSIDDQRFRVGSMADAQLPAARGGDGIIAYALSPALPRGLTFNASSRTISGTPTAATPRARYAFSATDEDGDSATLTFAIEVEPDLMPTFGGATVPAQQYRVSTAIIDLVLPPASGGDGTLTYGIAPALPSGLAYDAATRTVSGTPTMQVGRSEYTYTATDEDGDTATLALSIEVGMAITVAIADAAAPEGQTLSFAVTLSDAVPVAVAVAYRTIDGSARAGEDYVATTGVLTFAPGSTESTIGVAVNADPRPEHDEQFTLMLSELVNAEFADEQALGTIVDDDTERARGQALGRSLSVFGRAFAADALDAIGGRFQEGPPTTTPQAFASDAATGNGGQLALAMEGFAGNGTADRGHFAAASPFDHPSNGAAPFTATSHGFTGTGFALPFGGDAGDRSRATVWGRGSTSRVSSRPDATFVEGDIRTAYLGVDARLPRNTLIGLAVARSSADLEYRQTDVTEGEISLEMTTVLPYVHWTLCNGLDLWALAGSGQGEATLTDDLGRVDTDIDMRLAAFGLRNELTTWDELVWSLKADAFLAALEADAVVDALDAADADIQRLRVLLEGRREWQRSEQSLLGLTLELGARLDGGDGDSGLGTEIGGVLDYRNTAAGLGLEARGRYLLTHSNSALEDWGLSVALEFDPGARGTGASLRLAPAWGTPSSSAADLWRADRMFSARPSTRRFESKPRLDMEAGYGFHGKRIGAARIFGAITGNDGASPSYRIGSRGIANGLSWSLEFDRTPRAGDSADHGILFSIGNTRAATMRF